MSAGAFSATSTSTLVQPLMRRFGAHPSTGVFSGRGSTFSSRLVGAGKLNEQILRLCSLFYFLQSGEKALLARRQTRLEKRLSGSSAASANVSVAIRFHSLEQLEFAVLQELKTLLNRQSAAIPAATNSGASSLKQCHTWSCGRCTFINTSKVCCEMCGDLFRLDLCKAVGPDLNTGSRSQPVDLAGVEDEDDTGIMVEKDTENDLDADTTLCYSAPILSVALDNANALFLKLNMVENSNQAADTELQLSEDMPRTDDCIMLGLRDPLPDSPSVVVGLASCINGNHNKIPSEAFLPPSFTVGGKRYFDAATETKAGKSKFFGTYHRRTAVICVTFYSNQVSAATAYRLKNIY